LSLNKGIRIVDPVDRTRDLFVDAVDIALRHHVEKVCWNEEMRFARKIGFDIVRWDPFEPPDDFGTITQRFRFALAQFRRARQLFRK